MFYLFFMILRKVMKEWKIIASRGGYVRNHLNRTIIRFGWHWMLYCEDACYLNAVFGFCFLFLQETECIVYAMVGHDSKAHHEEEAVHVGGSDGRVHHQGQNIRQN